MDCKTNRCCLTCKHMYYENDEECSPMICGESYYELYVTEDEYCDKWEEERNMEASGMKITDNRSKSNVFSSLKSGSVYTDESGQYFLKATYLDTSMAGSYMRYYEINLSDGNMRLVDSDKSVTALNNAELIIS